MQNILLKFTDCPLVTVFSSFLKTKYHHKILTGVITHIGGLTYRRVKDIQTFSQYLTMLD